MYSHEIALALGQQLEDLLAERRGFLGPLDRWHRARVGGQHSADTLARHIQQACNLAFPYSLRMQLENRSSLRLAQHGWSLAPRFVGGVRSITRLRVESSAARWCGSAIPDAPAPVARSPGSGSVACRWCLVAAAFCRITSAAEAGVRAPCCCRDAKLGRLTSLPRCPPLFGERLSHAPAMLQADARHGHQVTHGQRRGDLAFAHQLLHRFGQSIRQRQPARHPVLLRSKRRASSSIEQPRRLSISSSSQPCSSALSGSLIRSVRSSSSASASLISHTTARTVSRPSCWSAAMRLWPSMTR